MDDQASACEMMALGQVIEIEIERENSPNGEACKGGLAFGCPWLSWRCRRTSYRKLKYLFGNI
jgi:hypothetical protein